MRFRQFDWGIHARWLFLNGLTLLLIGLAVWQASTQHNIAIAQAQDTTQEVTQTPEVTEPPTTVPPITVTSSEPSQINPGQAAVLSVFGANFTNQTTARLVGFGLLQVTFVNSGALTAVVPNSVPSGTHTIQISDPVRGTITSPNTLTVLVPTAAPPPTTAPLPTTAPITPIPGAPSLLIRSYSVNPSVVAPGGSFTLSVEVVNQGTRSALGISVAIGSGGSFFAANGQASALLPDILPGGSTVFYLPAVAATSATAGPNALTLAFAYRDFEGQAYTNNQSLTVTVQEISEASQVTLARYLIDPNPVSPGAAVNVTLLIMNSGNETATQALVRISTESGAVLLPGPEGDSFPLGDIAPGESVGIEIPLRVNTEADPGPQLQQITITYLQAGESQSVTASMTVEVGESQAPAPLFLVTSYDTGVDALKPGDRFTLTVNLQNAGNTNADDMLVTFGTVDSAPSGDGTPTGGAPSITSNTTFAPVGAGGTLFIGNVEAGETVELVQDFVVNGTVTSGIYNLPITLRYTKPDGTAAQENLRASIVVIVPPRLRLSLAEPLPQPANVGEPFTLAISMINFGRNDLNITFANIEAENAEVIDGSETYVGIMRSGDENVVEAQLLPFEEGTVTITLTLRYLNDFNQEQTIVETFETDALFLQPTDDFFGGGPDGEPIEIPIETPPPPSLTDTLGRLILGFLGLGS